MMWYAIMGEDVENSLPLRNKVREAHLARLVELTRQGRLLIAGPCPAVDADDPGPAGYTGSLVVADFSSLQEARAWADEDPYVTGGVYAKVAVKPFRRVLP
jgi:uncharacterized protein YciI